MATKILTLGDLDDLVDGDLLDRWFSNLAGKFYGVARQQAFSNAAAYN